MMNDDSLPDWFIELGKGREARAITDPEELKTIPEGSTMRNRFGTEFVWGGYHASEMGLGFWSQRLPVYLIHIPFDVFWSRLEEAANKGERLDRKAELLRRLRK